MKIVGLINKDSGPGFHRILMPLLLAQGVDVYVTNYLKEEDLAGVDWIYYNRTVAKEALRAAKQRNIKIAVDIDDYWHLDKHHIMYDLYQKNDFAYEQLGNIINADLITTTHERLAEAIRTVHDNVVVVPNAIPDHDYFRFTRTESPLIRVFWQGSITHEADIRMLDPSIRRINGKKNAMVMAGFTDHPVWHRMVKVYTRDMQLPGAVIPSKDPFHYYENYGAADIAVCPLIESKFNGYKSNLKILEAAAAKIPVIASHTHPYKDMPVLFATRTLDWHRYIADLTEDADMRRECAEQLHNYCNEHYNFQTINNRRMEAFGYEARKQDVPRSASGDLQHTGPGGVHP